MYSAVRVPADIPVQALAAALASIGLAPSTQRGRLLTFDRAPERAQEVLRRCAEPGCTGDGIVSRKGKNICAAHWLGTKRESIHE